MLHTSGRARACAAALVVAMLGLCVFAGSAAALPARFWGIVPQATPSAAQLQRLHRGGVDSIRIPFNWSALQPTKGGAIDWSDLDLIVEGATRNGIDVLPFLEAAPAWAVPQGVIPGTHGQGKAPARLPTSGAAASAWSSFVKQAVARYGSGGSFWSSHPSLPARPIRAWQIWNEPNFKYFVAHPNPAEYGKLVKLSSTAVHSVDAGAQVILAGLFAKPKGGRYLRLVGGRKKLTHATSPNFYASYFLEQMYKLNPGIKSKFSGVALHPYTPAYKYLPEEIEEFRRVLSQNRDAAKQLWITELSWSSEAPSGSDVFAKGVSGQARELKGAFTLLRNKAARWKLQRVFWFSVEDQPGSCNFCGGAGLFADGFVAKPSWSAYVQFAGGTP